MQLHVLSFEGPDDYARAGGIATRVTGLTEALASAGQETHLWFVGDPDLAGHEDRGGLSLHRWCQWISHYHRDGVYAGEEGKRDDYAASLPPFLFQEMLLPSLARGERAAILAEEWHTVDAVLHLDWLLREAGLRDRVTILWNANNTFGFERIDWKRLAKASVITTVSRYMKHRMWSLGVDPLVIPNGLGADALVTANRRSVAGLRSRLQNRTLISKMARWDPDKRWLLAIACVGQLKRLGLRPLLIARGGMEAHGAEVASAASLAGLRFVERHNLRPGGRGLMEALADLDGADVVSLRCPIDPDGRRLLFAASDAVLANSGHEPFGLVGLEAMAAGGVACTGCTGEDYAVHGRNALVLQTNDPLEFVGMLDDLRAHPQKERALRRAGRATAREYTWIEIIRRILWPRLRMLCGGGCGHGGPSEAQTIRAA